MEAAAQKFQRLQDIRFGSEHKLPNRWWDPIREPWQEDKRREEAFMENDIATHCEQWAQKLSAWPKLVAGERNELFEHLIRLPDNAMAAARSTGQHYNHGWGFDTEVVRTFWLTAHGQRLLTVVAPLIAVTHLFADELLNVFADDYPLRAGLCSDISRASAAQFSGIPEIDEPGTAAYRDWPWAGRVVRIEALYHGVLELSQNRMHAASAHFDAALNAVEAAGVDAAEVAPPVPERPTVGRCGWLLKKPRGYATDATHRRAIKKERRDKAKALYPFL